MTQPTDSGASLLTAEVVSIGDEMTSGARLDTNAQWLSRRLEELGVRVTFHTTVGDTLEDHVDVMRIATDRADVVVCTGGLGPTRDDLTRDALAQLVGKPLELDPESLAHIESLFARRHRDMPQRNRIQAMFPAGSSPITNPQGTAPGIELAVERPGQRPSRIFALPGVPAEMKRMFDDTVAPRILSDSNDESIIRHHVMKFFGVGESEMEQRLGTMISRDRQPRVGITVSTATISLRITARAKTERECDQQIEQTRAEILQRVPEYFFGEGEHFEQYHAIDQILRRHGQSLAIVELGFAAPLGDWFATLGATPAYRGAISLADYNQLSSKFECSDRTKTLQRVKAFFESDWVLMVDEYPEIDRGAETPLPAVPVRLDVLTPDQTLRTRESMLGGHPDVLQPRIGKAAMAWLRQSFQEWLSLAGH